MRQKIGSFTIETEDGNLSNISVEIKEPTTKEKLSEVATFFLNALSDLSRIHAPMSPACMKILLAVTDIVGDMNQGKLSSETLQSKIAEIGITALEINDLAGKLFDFEQEKTSELIGIMDGEERKREVEQLLKPLLDQMSDSRKESAERIQFLKSLFNQE